MFGIIPRTTVLRSYGYAVKPLQTSCEELPQSITYIRNGQEARIAEPIACDFCRFFLLFDHQEAFSLLSSRSMC